MPFRSTARFVLAASTTLAVCAAVVTGPVARAAEPTAWRSAGNGADDDHAAPDEHSLARDNVASLHQLWATTTKGDVPNIPTVEGDAVYSTDNGGSVWRLDRATGKPVWQVDIPTLTGSSADFSRSSPAVAADVVIVGDQMYGTVFALAKSDGHVVWKTRVSSSPMALVTSSPLAVGGRVYFGVSSLQEELAATQKGFKPDFRGSVVALDERDGHVVWQSYMVPSGFTGGGVWGSNLAVDAGRRALYATTGDNYSVPDSVSACRLKSWADADKAACLPPDDYVDSVVAIDLDDGHVRWVRRVTLFDTWTVSCLPSTMPPANPCPRPSGPDYDFGSAANLFSVTDAGGVRHDYVGAGQKSGVYWTFDRDNGRVVWATQVSPGGTRGGIEWGAP